MGEVLYKTQCPGCAESGGDTSGDNLIVYENGTSHCFACGYDSQGPSTVSSDLISGSYKEIANRGVSKKTCQHFGYQVGSYKGRTCHIENYFRDSHCVAQKLRFKDKDFKALGKIKEALLFGQHLYNSNSSTFCVVTEGALDAMSVAEICGIRYPVISLKNGAGAARKELSEQLEWLEGFKHIVICFDQDEVGQKAAESVSDLFTDCRICKLPLKDANEMILSGKGTELRSAIFNAKRAKPSTLLSVQDILDEGIQPPSMGITTGIHLLDNLAYGLHTGIYILCGGSGSGKSNVVRDIIGHILTTTSDIKAVLLSFEQTASDSLLRFAGYSAGKVLHKPGLKLDQNSIQEYLNVFQDKLYIHNNKDLPSAEDVSKKIRFYVKSTGCRLVVLDNLTALTASMEHERQGIDRLMSELGSLTVELNITLLLVSHLSKPDGGKTFEEGRKVTPSDLRGSQSLQFWSTLIFSVERNKLSEDIKERNTVTIRVLKDRLTGEAEGCTENLKYNTDTGMLESIPVSPDVNQFEQEGDVI